MIDLHGNGSPNVVKVIIACEELGLYRLIPVDVVAGDQFDPAFLALNPNGRVPVIVDRRVEPALVAFESTAILVHIAEGDGGLLPIAPNARAEVMQWTMLVASGLGPMLGQFMHFARFAPAGNDYGRERYRKEVARLCGILDRQIAAHEWLAVGTFSIADISAFPWIRLAFANVIDRAATPALGEWMDRIAARDPVARAERAAARQVEIDLRAFAAATPFQLDRLFNRDPVTVAD